LGKKKIFVRTAQPNEAHPFYEKLGFKRIKTQHVYLKELKEEEL
jgi:hypothetical protein